MRRGGAGGHGGGRAGTQGVGGRKEAAGGTGEQRCAARCCPSGAAIRRRTKCAPVRPRRRRRAHVLHHAPVQPPPPPNPITIPGSTRHNHAVPHRPQFPHRYPGVVSHRPPSAAAAGSLSRTASWAGGVGRGARGVAGMGHHCPLSGWPTASVTSQCSHGPRLPGREPSPPRGAGASGSRRRRVQGPREASHSRTGWRWRKWSEMWKRYSRSIVSASGCAGPASSAAMRGGER